VNPRGKKRRIFLAVALCSWLVAFPIYLNNLNLEELDIASPHPRFERFDQDDFLALLEEWEVVSGLTAFSGIPLLETTAFRLAFVIFVEFLFQDSRTSVLRC